LNNWPQKSCTDTVKLTIGITNKTETAGRGAGGDGKLKHAVCVAYKLRAIFRELHQRMDRNPTKVHVDTIPEDKLLQF